MSFWYHFYIILDDDSDVSFTPKHSITSLTVIDTTIKDWETLAKSVKIGFFLLFKKDINALITLLIGLKK